MLRASALSVEQLRAAPQHTVVLPELSTGRFYTEWIQTADKRVDCCPALFDEALERAHALFHELRDTSPEQLKLISLRTNFMQNSWYQNVTKLKGRKHLGNPLHMAVEDAARLNAEVARLTADTARAALGGDPKAATDDHPAVRAAMAQPSAHRGQAPGHRAPGVASDAAHQPPSLATAGGRFSVS